MADVEQLRKAVALASAGDWNGAHAIVQTDETDPLSCWLHACLHRIEGNAANARYWYQRAGRSSADHPDTQNELTAIATALA